jgi:hypothetical protein
VCEREREREREREVGKRRPENENKNRIPGICHALISSHKPMPPTLLWKIQVWIINQKRWYEWI